MNKKFDYQNTKLEKKLNRKALEDMNIQYVKTRDEFQMQSNVLTKKMDDQQMRVETMTKLFTKLNNELALRDVALSRVPLNIEEQLQKIHEGIAANAGRCSGIEKKIESKVDKETLKEDLKRKVDQSLYWELIPPGKDPKDHLK